ncbi:glucose-1-phosphate thymidylyltransferase RfbA [Frankia sp. AiPs1]|uniref:glucose-1-phosphate thymidylyltransferase RfbA n=1 Tax=Frankia sp. AiPs1 TaxID=573493 RepID=UPI002043131F|nr:glucose-1-phosphate thymidylyltransferase RfbA [Frankia sp. AiPs1]MCM3920976.1 glucose-1-phosphate thymidylyltransferase RfbA [Frankia sp. AiPs1]
MKGIILAGGNATRLRPVTAVTSKQLLPVYDKPMIYYPLSVLMLSGIREILVITTGEDQPQFRRLLGDGSDLGLRLTYAVQTRPRGLADAFLLGADHIGDHSVALILGDNVFHGSSFIQNLRAATERVGGCRLFGYPVSDPHRYGIAEVDAEGRLLSLAEKPTATRSNLAVTGLYLYDNDVVSIAQQVRPSPRGELEITDINQVYLDQGRAALTELGRGTAWLDTGTFSSLMEAGQYIEILERRQGARIACIEEVALRMGYIDAAACLRLGKTMENSDYGRYVIEVATGSRIPELVP